VTRYIRDGRLRPGAPVPSEVQLGRELGVSRGIVREAYRALGAVGILDTANGRAPRVGALSSRVLTRFVEHALATGQVSSPEVLALAAPLEIRAAQLAAEHRTEEDLAAIVSEVDVMQSPRARWQDLVEADIRCHAAIGHAAGNRLFALVGKAFTQPVVRSIHYGYRPPILRADRRRFGRIHAAIAEAIARRDSAAAGDAMREHFDAALAAVLRRTRPARQPPNGGRNGNRPGVVSSVSHPGSKDES
jgi:GntR family transcriptional repressor for pyruvate dehydrogenase complex